MGWLRGCRPGPSPGVDVGSFAAGQDRPRRTTEKLPQGLHPRLRPAADAGRPPETPASPELPGDEGRRGPGTTGTPMTPCRGLVGEKPHGRQDGRERVFVSTTAPFAKACRTTATLRPATSRTWGRDTRPLRGQGESMRRFGWWTPTVCPLELEANGARLGIKTARGRLGRAGPSPVNDACRESVLPTPRRKDYGQPARGPGWDFEEQLQDART